MDAFRRAEAWRKGNKRGATRDRDEESKSESERASWGEKRVCGLRWVWIRGLSEKRRV